MDWIGLDWMDWMDPAEKPSPLRAPVVLKILWENPGGVAFQSLFPVRTKTSC